MKKFFMIAVMAVAALSANAQTWLGGSIGFNSTKVDGADKATTTFSVKPELGYNLSDNWAIAVALGYSYSSASSTNTFTVNPYARYTFVKIGNFSAFCDGGVAYGTAHVQGDKKNTNLFTVGFNPGLAYAISPKVTLVAHIGDLSYTHTWKDDVKANTFNFGLDNSISFGAYVNL